MASLEIRPIHSPTSAMLTVNSTLILSWEHKWVSEPRSLVPTENGQTTEAIHHAVTTEEATIAAIGTTQGAIVVHSPDKTEGDNDVSFQTITVITTGIAPSVTIQISPDGRYATVAKSLAQVAEAGNVKVVETISNAETVSRAVGVKPSTITIGPALNARILIFHSVRSATDVKPHAPEAVAADEVAAVAEATETVDLRTEVAEAVAVATETVDLQTEAAEAVAEAEATVTVALQTEATEAVAVAEATVTVDLQTEAAEAVAVAEATVTGDLQTEAAVVVAVAEVTETVALRTEVAEAVTVAEATETVALQTEVVEAEIMLVAVETDAVVNAAEAITVRPKESGLVMHITVHHVTCSRVSLNAKTRTEEAI